MREVGQKLKELREQKGLSINEIALATKINPRVLKAIEEGDVQNLPPRTFLRGFLRSYAQFLKVDPEPFLSDFKDTESRIRGRPETTIPEATIPPVEIPLPVGVEESASAIPEAPILSGPSAPAPKENVRPSLPGQKRSIWGTGAIVAGLITLIVLILIVQRLIEKYEKEATLPPQAEVDQTGTPPLPETAPTTNDAATTEGSATTPAAASPTTTETTKPDEKPAETAAASTPENPPAEPPKPIVEPAKPVEPPKPVAEVKPAAEAKPAPEAKPVAEVKPPEAKPALIGKPQEIIIEALDQVEVTYQIDGGPKRTMRLNAEQVKTLRGKKSVVLEVSDGGAVNLIQNFQDKGTPGDLGKPATIQFQ